MELVVALFSIQNGVAKAHMATLFTVLFSTVRFPEELCH